MNQRIPATQFRPMYAHATASVTMKMFASTNPMSSACHHVIRELSSQNGAANNRVSTTGASPMMNSSPMLNDAGSRLSWTFHAAGSAHGAFQPPRNSVTNSAETMNTFTYSAKKKKPKRIPEYSVANPAT